MGLLLVCGPYVTSLVLENIATLWTFSTYMPTRANVFRSTHEPLLLLEPEVYNTAWVRGKGPKGPNVELSLGPSGTWYQD